MNSIQLPETMTVKELATQLGLGAPEVIKFLLEHGTMATINQNVDFETAQLVASNFGLSVSGGPSSPSQQQARHPSLDLSHAEPGSLVARPPVVTVLGHVDHGKTSLLDAIRETRVASGEAGGITQSIGAYQVEKAGRQITFIDTPGHAAFTAMRARGANVTDVAVLVVAADDGIMPQTDEAIQHARNANVPIIVALNKIDRDNANPDRVLQQLADRELVPEEYGGDTPVVRTSAKTGQGIDELLEMILLVSDIAEPKAQPNGPAAGTIIDSHMEKGRGAVATVLVQTGTLHVGDMIVAGSAYGKVRSLISYSGKRIKAAPPGSPVLITGLSDVSVPGEVFETLGSERAARAQAEGRSDSDRKAAAAPARKVTLADLASAVAEGQMKHLNLVLKADTNGALEALRGQIEAIQDPHVLVKIVGDGVGPVSESDINLASVSNSIVIGFNVRPDAAVKALADTEGVDVRFYDVVYQVTDDLDRALKGLYEPTFIEVPIGKIEVRKVFTVDGKPAIAGSHVIEGKITRNSICRVRRDGSEVIKAKVAQLRRGRDDAREVNHGFECGITLEGFADFREGDLLEAFVIEQQNA